MDQHNPNHWRQMFGERQQRGQQSAPNNTAASRSASFGFDDGYDPAREQANGREPPLSPEDITDEAALALALDAPEYRPWILQRGRTRPVMMLHLRRFDTRSQLWQGWQLSYPHLVAVEYTGDTMLSLDFGTRQFMIEGTGLGELTRHLQQGTVLMMQEYTASQWSGQPQNETIGSIRLLAS